MTRERFSAAKAIVLGRQKNPSQQRECPVCGLHAQNKYFCEYSNKWVYKHTKRVPGTKGGTFAKTHYHEAER